MLQVLCYSCTAALQFLTNNLAFACIGKTYIFMQLNARMTTAWVCLVRQSTSS